MNIFIIGETLLRNRNIKFAYVVKDNKELNLRYNQFKSLFPNLEVLKLPSWDCPPYDLSSPDNKIATERINTFLNLSNREENKRLVLISLNALIQKNIPKTYLLKTNFHFKTGSTIDYKKFQANLVNTGYKKSETDSHKKTSLQFVYGEQKLSSKDGFNLGLVFSHEPYDLDDDTEESTNVLGLFGGYANEGIRVGLEWNQRDDSVQDSTDNITSLYMNYDLQSNKSVFLKYNMVSSGDDDTNYLVAGMEFAPTKGLMIAPNYRNDGDNSKFAVNFQFKF